MTPEEIKAAITDIVRPCDNPDCVGCRGVDAMFSKAQESEEIMCEPNCKKCGGQMDWVDCWSGCDDGYFDGYEEDPLWFAPGELEVCGNCEGKGGWWQCFNSRCQREATEATVKQ